MEIGLGINKALCWSGVGSSLQGDRDTVCVSGKRIGDRDSLAKILLKCTLGVHPVKGGRKGSWTEREVVLQTHGRFSQLHRFLQDDLSIVSR